LTSRQTALRLAVWLLAVMLGVAVLAGLGLGLRSADAQSRLERLEASLGEDRLALDHAFMRGSNALTRAARQAGEGADPKRLLHEVFAAAPGGLVAASFHGADGRPEESRPQPHPSYLHHLNPDLLPTVRPRLSQPFRPESGELALAVLVPIHPEPGAVRGYFSGALDLTPPLLRLRRLATDRRFALTLVDRHGRPFLGPDPDRAPPRANHGAGEQLGSASRPFGEPAMGENLLRLNQPMLGWSVLIWSPPTPETAHRSTWLLLALAILGLILLLRTVSR
jgi:hypothetical protein